MPTTLVLGFPRIPGMSYELLISDKKFLRPAKAEKQYRHIVIAFAVGGGRGRVNRIWDCFIVLYGLLRCTEKD